MSFLWAKLRFDILFDLNPKDFSQKCQIQPIRPCFLPTWVLSTHLQNITTNLDPCPQIGMRITNQFETSAAPYKASRNSRNTDLICRKLSYFTNSPTGLSFRCRHPKRIFFPVYKPRLHPFLGVEYNLWIFWHLKMAPEMYKTWDLGCIKPYEYTPGKLNMAPVNRPLEIHQPESLRPFLGSQTFPYENPPKKKQPTLPKTNSSSLKIGPSPKRKIISLPTINFQVLC